MKYENWRKSQQIIVLTKNYCKEIAKNVRSSAMLVADYLCDSNILAKLRKGDLW